jgi:outer membrane protein assembly factor BamB
VFAITKGSRSLGALLGVLAVLTMATATRTGDAALAEGHPLSLDAMGDWPQYGHGPEHDSFNPDETVLSPATVGGLKVHWRVRPRPFEAFGAPLVAGSTVFGTVAGQPFLIVPARVEAVDATTGSLKWTFDLSTTTQQHSDGVQAVAGGVAYVGDTSTCGFSCRVHTLYALDAATGAVLWHTTIQNPASGVVISNGLIYLGDDSDEIALSTTDGTERWRRDIGFPTREPTVGGGLVYVPAADGLLHALHASTGTKAWAIPGTHAFARSAYADGVLYTGGASGELMAVDASTGDVLWSIPTDVNGYPQLAVAGGNVFFGDLSGHVIAVRASDGQGVWQVRLADGRTSFTQPSVANGVVYVSFERTHRQHGHLVALNAADGTMLWSTQGFADEVAISNGMVFVALPDQGERTSLYGYGL